MSEAILSPLSLFKIDAFQRLGITDGNVRSPGANTGFSVHQLRPSEEPALLQSFPGDKVFVPIIATVKSGPPAIIFAFEEISSSSLIVFEMFPQTKPGFTKGPIDGEEMVESASSFQYAAS